MSFNENKLFWEEFLAEYKNYQCLWKVKSKEFMNSELRNAAYQNLIIKCKEIHPEADLAYVKKKIDSLRNSYRRELRKVRQSTRTGSSSDDVYVPSLWYFNLLQFTSDQEEARAGTSSISSPPYSLADDSLTNELPSPSTSSDVPPHQGASTVKNKKTTINLAQKKAKFLDIASNELQQRYKEQAFGDSVAFDLDQMDDIQCIIAKKMISEIMYNGRMGLLNVNSNISVQAQNITSYSCPEYVPNYQQTSMQSPSMITLYPRDRQRQPYVTHEELSEQVYLPNINIIEDVSMNNLGDINKYIKFNDKK